MEKFAPLINKLQNEGINTNIIYCGNAAENKYLKSEYVKKWLKKLNFTPPDTARENIIVEWGFGTIYSWFFK